MVRNVTTQEKCRRLLESQKALYNEVGEVVVKKDAAVKGVDGSRQARKADVVKPLGKGRCSEVRKAADGEAVGKAVKSLCAFVDDGLKGGAAFNERGVLAATVEEGGGAKFGQVGAKFGHCKKRGKGRREAHNDTK